MDVFFIEVSRIAVMGFDDSSFVGSTGRTTRPRGNWEEYLDPPALP
jgi:hypothetical protein